jgi:hypothetical protein
MGRQGRKGQNDECAYGSDRAHYSQRSFKILINYQLPSFDRLLI